MKKCHGGILDRQRKDRFSKRGIVDVSIHICEAVTANERVNEDIWISVSTKRDKGREDERLSDDVRDHGSARKVWRIAPAPWTTRCGAARLSKR